MKTNLRSLYRAFQKQKSFRCRCLQLIGAAVFFIICSLNTHLANGASSTVGSASHLEASSEQ